MRLVPIRPAVLLATVLAMSACGGSAEEDTNETVAQVGEETLTGSQLTATLLRAPRSPDRILATGMVSTWTDMAMVLTAVDRGIDLTGDSILRAISTPEMMERTIRAYATQRGIDGVSPTAGQVDSLIRWNQIRVFRIHRFPVDVENDSLRNSRAAVLFDIYTATLTGQSVAEATAAQPAAALLDMIVDSPPALGYDDVPPELARVIWRLAEGETSRPVVGNDGVQLFERVTAVEGRPALTAHLQPRLQAAADKRFVDSLIATRDLKVTEGAIGRLRSALNEPLVVGGEEPLATWDGGEVTPAEARMWIAYLLPAERARLGDAAEVTLELEIMLMARREILFALAAGSGVADSAALRGEVMAEYADSIPGLWDGATTRTDADGQPVGMASSMIMAVVEGNRPYHRLPGTLGGWLRDRFEFRFDAQAMDRAGRSASRLWPAPDPTALEGNPAP
jgi:hypothetical protein